MISRKRPSVSLSSNVDDTSFQSKKASSESLLGGHGATVSPSSETSMTPSLDRRKAARQHVRALNTEFASWVQSQLRDHPDELWEDGARVYLSQASEILEKFSDVVKWLKSNTSNESNALETQINGKKDLSQTNNNLKPTSNLFSFSNTNTVPSSNSGPQSSLLSSTTSSASTFTFGLSPSSQPFPQSSSAFPVTSSSFGVSFESKSLAPVKTVSFSSSPTFGVSSNSQGPLLASTTSFTSSTSSGLFSNSQIPSFGSWNSGAFSTSQSSFSFGLAGSQKPAALNDVVKEDADADDEPEQPSSPSVKSSEEKGITVVLETKCKLYIKSTDPSDKEPWKDKGAGKLFIKCQEGATKGTKESKPRILVRNDVGRIMLNASLYRGIKTQLQKNAIVTIFHTSDDSGENGKAIARTFLIRVKNEEERNKLADTIREHAPAS